VSLVPGRRVVRPTLLTEGVLEADATTRSTSARISVSVSDRRGRENRREAPGEQACAVEQHHRQRNLKEDEELHRAVPAGRGAADAALLDGGGQLGAGEPQRGDDAEQHPRQHRERDRVAEGRRVEPEIAQERQGRPLGGWDGGGERRQRGAGEDPPEDRTRQTEQEAFREQLPHQVSAGGPERGADRHLVLPGHGPGEEEVGDVGAGEHEQEHHRAPEHQEHRPDRANLRVPERDGLDSDVQLIDGEVRAQPRREGIEATLGLGERDAAPQAGHDADPGRIAPGRGVPGRDDGEQHLRQAVSRDGGRFHAGPAEVGPEDADDCHRPALDAHAPADDRRIRGEALAPEGVGEHRQLGCLEPFLLGAEVPAEERVDAEHVEEVAGDRGGVDHLGPVAEADRDGAVVVRRDPGEEVHALPELQEPGPRVAEGPALVIELDLIHMDQPIGIPEGKGADQRRVEHRVDGGVEPDPQREREDDHRREAWPGEQRADGGPDVAEGEHGPGRFNAHARKGPGSHEGIDGRRAGPGTERPASGRVEAILE
jgi:hypothetical protein